MTSDRLPRILVIVHAIVLVVVVALQPAVPRSESRKYRIRPEESHRLPGGQGISIAISQQPLGTAFVAERLWHPFYFPVWLKTLTVLDTPSLILTVLATSTARIPLQSLPPWLRSWLTATLFLGLSSAQWWFLAKAFNSLAKRVRHSHATVPPA